MIGKTILQYEIIEQIGEGGMGTVYKAKDTKLDRFVALKFLPSQLATTEDEKARFIQEAKAASALNHPNVCTIHDIQEFGGQLFIVMEFIDGVTLKDNEQVLSEKKILEYAAQIAEGLAAAHEKGIVHRDIKPDNIMIRKDGIVQIMDFGLAKLYTDSNVSRLTKAGTTMGTMGYMSPEQVQGMEVDHRTDIFSLGVVLYELFAGESPFKGMHETAIMYEIVNVEVPPISTIKQDIDQQLEVIILECLEKDRDDRCQSAKELARNLRKIKRVSTGTRTSRMYNVNSDAYQKQTNTQAVNQSTSGSISIEAFNKKIELNNIFSLRNISWLITLVLLAYILIQKPWVKIEPSKTVIKFSTDLDKDTFFELNYPAVNISNDGLKIVYNANSNLYLRNLGSIDAVIIPGTENAINPVFSPDGKQIVFFQLGKLKKLSLNGGTSSILVSTANVSRGVSWGSSKNIVYSPSTVKGIFLIPDKGGSPKQITFIDSLKNERTHRWPHFLPDGKHVLFTVGTLNSPDYYEDANIDIVDIETGKRTNLISGASSAKYINTGHIIYTKSGTLFAIPFDVDNLKIEGQPVPIIEGINGDLTSGAMHYSISDNGTLTYIPGDVEGGNRSLILINQDEEKLLDITPNNYIEPKMSPDGKNIALVAREGTEFDIWIYNIERKSLRKFTFGGQNRTPTWTPDGKAILYMHTIDASGTGIFIKKADGSQIEKEIYRDNGRIYIDGVSNNGKTLLIQKLGGKGSQTDLYYLEINGNKKLKNYLVTNDDEFTSAISPDGKWVAYVSSESERYQAYIQSFPVKSGKLQISINGASSVVWAPDGKTIYYESNSIIYAVPVSFSNTITVGQPKEFLKGHIFSPVDSGHLFDITSDSKYILTTKPIKGGNDQKINVVINWFVEIEKVTRVEN